MKAELLSKGRFHCPHPAAKRSQRELSWWVPTWLASWCALLRTSSNTILPDHLSCLTWKTQLETTKISLGYWSCSIILQLCWTKLYIFTISKIAIKRNSSNCMTYARKTNRFAADFLEAFGKLMHLVLSVLCSKEGTVFTCLMWWFPKLLLRKCWVLLVFASGAVFWTYEWTVPRGKLLFLMECKAQKYINNIDRPSWNSSVYQTNF